MTRFREVEKKRYLQNEILDGFAEPVRLACLRPNILDQIIDVLLDNVDCFFGWCNVDIVHVPKYDPILPTRKADAK